MAERPQACPEWQEDLAGWLVAQVSADREAALHAHLATCSGCRAEVDSLLGVAAVALSADPDGHVGLIGDPPSPDLGDRIAKQVAFERRAQRLVRSSLALVGVAAVALIAVLVIQRDEDAPLRGEPVAFVIQPAGVDASAVVAPDSGGSLVELTASGLDPDTTYALWLTPPGKTYEDRVAAGTFRPDEDGNVDERLHSALPAKDTGRVWVTDPEGDITLDTKP